MVDVVNVKVWHHDMGALSWDKKKQLGFFEYYPDFLKKNIDVSPIHMSIRSAPKIFSFPTLNKKTFRGLPGLISDVLPDDFGNQLINTWIKQNNIAIKDFNPLDRLCYIGERGMGALSFEPAKHQTPKAFKLDIDKLLTLTEHILSDRQGLTLNAHETEELNELVKVGTSAGGQRAKAIIAYNSETGELRSGQTKAPKEFKYYLFKFDGVKGTSLHDPVGFGRIEFAYYLMAKACGIQMMPSCLLEENGRAHFMTQRFDRDNDYNKFHMQTLCALAHYDFNQAGRYSYEDAFTVMRKLRLPHSDAVQLFKRMVFNVLARNQDDHTKNISFLMDANAAWKLAPAYDMTYAYNPEGFWTNEHQMSINGKSDQFLMEDLLAIGKSISYKQAEETIQQIVTVLNQWPKFADEAGMPKKQIIGIQQTFRKL